MITALSICYLVTALFAVFAAGVYAAYFVQCAFRRWTPVRTSEGWELLAIIVSVWAAIVAAVLAIGALTDLGRYLGVQL